MEATEEETGQVLRSKGFFWLASRPAESLVWSQAGGLFRLAPGGRWWADQPRDRWPDDESELFADFSDEVLGQGPHQFTVGDRRYLLRS